MITTTITTKPPVVIVSGAVRSGTSLVMRILAAAGVPVLSDDRKPPDEFNPHGYFESRAVLRLRRGDASWLADCHGKAVKVLPSPLIQRLPDTMPARVVWMMRDPLASAASFYDMVKAGKRPAAKRFNLDNREEFIAGFAGMISKNRDDGLAWLEGRASYKVIKVGFEDMMETPQPVIERILSFVGVEGDAVELSKLVDPKLWRHRAADVVPMAVKAGNFAGAVFREGAARIQRKPSLSPEEVERRREICAVCEYLDTDSQTCSLCGCPVRRKTAWRSTTCPDGKW